MHQDPHHPTTRAEARVVSRAVEFRADLLLPVLLLAVLLLLL